MRKYDQNSPDEPHEIFNNLAILYEGSAVQPSVLFHHTHRSKLQWLLNLTKSNPQKAIQIINDSDGLIRPLAIYASQVHFQWDEFLNNGWKSFSFAVKSEFFQNTTNIMCSDDWKFIFLTTGTESKALYTSAYFHKFNDKIKATAEYKEFWLRQFLILEKNHDDYPRSFPFLEAYLEDDWELIYFKKPKTDLLFFRMLARWISMGWYSSNPELEKWLLKNVAETLCEDLIRDTPLWYNVMACTSPHISDSIKQRIMDAISLEKDEIYKEVEFFSLRGFPEDNFIELLNFLEDKEIIFKSLLNRGLIPPSLRKEFKEYDSNFDLSKLQPDNWLPELLNLYLAYPTSPSSLQRAIVLRICKVLHKRTGSVLVSMPAEQVLNLARFFGEEDFYSN